MCVLCVFSVCVKYGVFVCGVCVLWCVCMSVWYVCVCEECLCVVCVFLCACDVCV